MEGGLDQLTLRLADYVVLKMGDSRNTRPMELGDDMGSYLPENHAQRNRTYLPDIILDRYCRLLCQKDKRHGNPWGYR